MNIIVHERPNHVLLEFAFEIHHVERHIQMLGHAPRIVDIIYRTAAMLSRTVALQLRQSTLIPKLHREADDRIPTIAKHCSNRRAIHTAAHRHGSRVRSGKLP